MSPFVYDPAAQLPLSGPPAALPLAVTSTALESVTAPVAVICDAPWTLTLAWYSRSRPAWLMPVPLPFSLMSLRTSAPSETDPLQPEMPVNLWTPEVTSRPV